MAGLLERIRDRGEGSAIRHLQKVLDLLRSNPGAWGTVRMVLDDVRHDEAPGDANAAVRRWAAAFDRAACASPEGSVALYALGNPELLKAATEEVVDRLRDWGLIGRERDVLDLGCGIGRFGAALAGQVGGYVGIDISGEMIAAARRRCAGLSECELRPNIRARSVPFPRRRLRSCPRRRRLSLSRAVRDRAGGNACHGGGAGAQARRRPPYPELLVSGRPGRGSCRPFGALPAPAVSRSSATARDRSAFGMGRSTT